MNSVPSAGVAAAGEAAYPIGLEGEPIDDVGEGGGVPQDGAVTGPTYDDVSNAGHAALGVLGGIPVAGVVFDVVDLAWTAAELPSGHSDLTDLALAGASVATTVVPGGDQAVAALKVAKRLDAAAEAIEPALDTPEPTDLEINAAADGLPVIHAQAGSTGHWNSELNAPLQPDTVYALDNGHAYLTDGQGRVIQAEGQIDGVPHDRNGYQQRKVGALGGQGYDGGHLIGSNLGGAGEAINIVPQESGSNRGAYRVMEDELAAAARAGSDVELTVSPVYTDPDAVPDRIDVAYSIDGVTTTQPFPN